MARDKTRGENLILALDAADAGTWDRAHGIVQSLEDDPIANWLHALLHKVEGDSANARYWYARSPARFDQFHNADTELSAIRAALRR